MDGLKIYPLQSSRWAEGMRALSFVLLLLSSPFGEPHEYFFPLLSLVRGGTYETFSKLELFYKWKSLWLYMRLPDEKRFFDNFAVLIPPGQIIF